MQSKSYRIVFTHSFLLYIPALEIDLPLNTRAVPRNQIHNQEVTQLQFCMSDGCFSVKSMSMWFLHNLFAFNLDIMSTHTDIFHMVFHVEILQYLFIFVIIINFFTQNFFWYVRKPMSVCIISDNACHNTNELLFSMCSIARHVLLSGVLRWMIW